MKAPALPTAIALVALAGAPPALHAHDGPAPQRIEIEARYEQALGLGDAASEGVVRGAALRQRPLLRPGEVLELVPGVVVTQHSGDGKANQFFVRGFNLDHGTDFATSLDGVPLNAPSHAHGQGYTDLNPLIPELVERVAYRKGPYFARNGDFSAAGSADIAYRRHLDGNFGTLTLGPHGYRRGVAGGGWHVGSADLVGALELQRNDGPWTLPQALHKTNAYVSAATGDAQRGGALSLAHTRTRWQATDQIPQRAIADGRLGRFDAVDTTDGGRSARTALAAEWHAPTADGRWQARAWLTRSRLALFSNFTYALDRPDDGDQFEQAEQRRALGGELSREFRFALGERPARVALGLQGRADRVQAGLYDTRARLRLATVREDTMRLASAGAWAEADVEWTPGLRSVLGLRADRQQVRVDALQPQNSGRAAASQLSPKLALVAQPGPGLELFVNAGRGFHSNDARGATAGIDPRSGEPLTPVPLLAASRGAELGLRAVPLRGLEVALAAWTLATDGELVYVGDAGGTEATRPARRVGLEWNTRWQPHRALRLDADLAWTRARYTEAAPEGDRIPGAVGRVAMFALTVLPAPDWTATLQLRAIGPRPLTEDGSLRAASSVLTNLRIARALGPRAELGLDVFNLANRRANDIEYAYASRLPGEAAPVFDRHVHPAEPRALRLTLQVRL